MIFYFGQTKHILQEYMHILQKEAGRCELLHNLQEALMMHMKQYCHPYIHGKLQGNMPERGNFI